MDIPDDQTVVWADTSERAAWTDPATTAEIRRMLEEELTRGAPPAAEETVAEADQLVASSDAAGAIAPIVLAQLPRPRPARGLGPTSVGTGRLDRSSPLEHWAIELFGVPRSVLNLAWALLSPAEREAWLAGLLAARRRQRESQSHEGPPGGDRDD